MLIRNTFFPNNLKLRKTINIGLVGSGRMAHEYAKVIQSFNHNIVTIVTKKNVKKDKYFSKYKYLETFSSFNDAIKKSKKVDAWIICTSWNKLKKYFTLALNNKIAFLIEKSIIISSSELTKLKKKNYNNNFLIGYNRNYYDYIHLLIKILKNNPPKQINMVLPEPYYMIMKKQKKMRREDLILYMTSHWISLILKICNLLNYKTDFKNLSKFKISNNSSNKVMIFNVQLKEKKIPIILTLLPDNPSNTSISFYCKNLNIILSPIEVMKIQYGLKKIKIKNQNAYKPILKTINVNDNYKPGLRFMYYDFITSCVLKTKKTLFGTKLDELIKIYKFCEILKKS